LFGADPSVALTLVSDTNALLFTPMLAEVAGGSLEPSHISAPLRASLKRTRVVRGRVATVDLDGHCVRLAPDRRLALLERGGEEESGEPLHYDQLVLAPGSVPQYFGSDEIQSHALSFRSLTDAIHIRNHVIGRFDRADREPDPTRRQAMLTFVVAGGGFAGAELAGALNDFARGMLALYPNVPLDEVRIVLVHPRERILPELSEPLAAYALRQMTARGVTFRLNTRVAGARPGVVVLQPHEEIRTETFVWTAGSMPNPLLAQLPVERDKRGAVVVDATLGVPGWQGVWACGDCAAVPDGLTGKVCPPTAQFAVRQAGQLARNLFASVRGRPTQSFRFNSLGMLCVVGYHTACAEIKGLRFSGLFAWLLWRGIYLSKLPGWERKLRVSVDWLIELFFPRDMVQTGDLATED
jgi:NADH dehydrogenase